MKADKTTNNKQITIKLNEIETKKNKISRTAKTDQRHRQDQRLLKTFCTPVLGDSQEESFLSFPLHPNLFLGILMA